MHAKLDFLGNDKDQVRDDPAFALTSYPAFALTSYGGQVANRWRAGKKAAPNAVI
jgi:hypothetical protein